MQRTVLGILVLACSGAIAAGQPQSGAQFDVVSIKLNTNSQPGSQQPPVERPDGGFRMTRVPVMTLIARAYPPAIPTEMIGLPDWVRNEYYGVSATSSLSRATAEDRVTMMRSMLAERFKLVAHIEQREQQTFDLVLARRDGRLGSGLTQSTTECNDVPPQALPSRADFSQPPPPCTLRMVGSMLRPSSQAQLGDVLEGAPIARLADLLRVSAGRVVVDKTGLAGSYHVTLNYDMMAARRPPSVTPAPDSAPAVFTAIQEQLGLKLEPSRTPRDTLIIDHIERPTPD
jgi:uncharacterized protein (TIGR03435 family)